MPATLAPPSSFGELLDQYADERRELLALLLANGVRLDEVRADVMPIRALRAIAVERGIVDRGLGVAA